LSETSRKLHSECIGNSGIWKGLLKNDFHISILVKGQFANYHNIYAMIYKSQLVFEERNHVTFSGMLPDWMFTWCTLCSSPPGARFYFLPVGRTKKIWGLTDDELPTPELNGHRRNIGWSEAREAAVIKWQTESCFQEQVLKKLFRVVKKVESLFPEEARNRRMRLFKTLRLGEKYSAMEDVLVKNRSTPTYLSYFQPQLIGEHYINGKLHRFGRKQLREYIKFARRLYDDSKSKLEEVSEADLVDCVLLTYKDLSRRAENHLIKWKIFLDSSHKFVTRHQKVWKWQNEKGVCHQVQNRSTERVQANKAYREYINSGDVCKFRLLRRHFEGLEKISEWISMNSWILDVLDTPVRETLVDRDNVVIPLPGRNNDAKDLQRKMSIYLVSGKEQDFRMVLSAIVSIAKNRLRRSANLLGELEGLIRNENANLLVSVETEVFVKDIYKVTSAHVDEKGFGKRRGMKSARRQARKRTRSSKHASFHKENEQLPKKSVEELNDKIDDRNNFEVPSKKPKL